MKWFLLLLIYFYCSIGICLCYKMNYSFKKKREYVITYLIYAIAWVSMLIADLIDIKMGGE